MDVGSASYIFAETWAKCVADASLAVQVPFLSCNLIEVPLTGYHSGSSPIVSADQALIVTILELESAAAIRRLHDEDVGYCTVLYSTVRCPDKPCSKIIAIAFFFPRIVHF